MDRFFSINVQLSYVEVIILTAISAGLLEILPLSVNIWRACEEPWFAILLAAFLLVGYLLIGFGIIRRNYLLLEIMSAILLLASVLEFLDLFFDSLFVDYGNDVTKDCDCVLRSSNDLSFAVYDLLTMVIVIILLVIQCQRYRSEISTILLRNDANAV
ncbi:hypothetical protein HDE_01563 [Halotydeus destructor]|nr:hypothetical protein HDE_01563 [Halotydeus destructor]